MWDPQIASFDATHIRDNLTDWFMANQADALKWANGGRALPPIVDFHKSPRLVTRFPSLTWLQLEHDAKWGDIMVIDLSATFEVAIIHGDKDELASRGPKYSMAFESMLVNVPETTFRAGSIIDITSTGMGVQTAFAVQEKIKAQFIEVFQTKASWTVEMAAMTN